MLNIEDDFIRLRTDEVAEVVDITNDIASNALQTIKNIAITVEKHENLRAVQEIFMVRAM